VPASPGKCIDRSLMANEATACLVGEQAQLSPRAIGANCVVSWLTSTLSGSGPELVMLSPHEGMGVIR